MKRLALAIAIAGTCLLQPALSQADYPKTKSTFTKGGVPAQWAPGHPKTWGQETYSHPGATHPHEAFAAAVTDDEKYLVMINGTHVNFIDLERNATRSSSSLQKQGIATPLFPKDLRVISSTQVGGYHVLSLVYEAHQAYPPGQQSPPPDQTLRLRVGEDLSALGTANIYDAKYTSISTNNKLALLSGQVFDLEGPDPSKPTTILKIDSMRLADLSFGPAGALLASARFGGGDSGGADVWNGTTGERVLALATGMESYREIGFAQLSPGGRHVALLELSEGLQVYDLEDVDAGFKNVSGYWFTRSPVWSPSGDQIALADDGRLRVFRVPGMELEQAWVIDVGVTTFYEITGVAWLDDGTKITWLCHWGRYLYDFETNELRLWAPRATDRSWGEFGVYLLKKTRYVVTVDGDATVRFWKE